MYSCNLICFGAISYCKGISDLLLEIYIPMEDVIKFRNSKQKITSQPIIYKWWFKYEIIDLLLNKLEPQIEKNKILVKDGYALLYVGSGVNGHDRLVKYHILDANNYHRTGVENGRLSSLRQTLCGLLGCEMTSGSETINNFIDKYARVEFEVIEAKTKNELEKIETEEIRKHYLPLNWQHTKGILTSDHRKILSALKKKVRK